MGEKSKSPIHLLLRFSDSLLKEKSTIDEHNQIKTGFKTPTTRIRYAACRQQHRKTPVVRRR
jgi:hypothetical protein